MKTTASFLLILLVLTGTIALAQNSEESAIREVIEGETRAWLERDFDQWASYWSHTPDAYFSVTMNQYIEFAEGWQAIADRMKNAMQQDTTVMSNINVARSEWHFRVNNNLAWARFSQSTNNGPLLKEQRVMEKVDGKWKIINMTTVNPSSYPVEARNPEP
uniref:Nuclear transport factor 2 family protein n=1 Tax=Roseihalotalea indica TaxID=2867963 RepID=A0AA49GQE2_9BACT|nr:nuclear transport factor 2 family protein [Tunicatimonas sp. TK19036]